MRSDRLFGPSFSTDAMAAVVSDVAWVQAMLDVEAAIARAEATVGLIPEHAAVAIGACCVAARFDFEQLGRDALLTGNPVVPLVRAVTTAVPGDAAGFVHWGATSQDVLDTAMMLICRKGLALIADDLGGVAAAVAGLTKQHRATLMPGRTLLQQALPITFGLKTAGWLAAIVEANTRLRTLQRTSLAVQFGGAAGTLASIAPHGLAVLRALSADLDLVEPVVPWHTARGRVAEIAMTLGLIAGIMGKVALDVALLTQTEVGELSEPADAGRGASSSMPQKRNPVGAVAVAACVRAANAQVMVLLGAMAQEHERAAGAWQAEWPAISDLLCLTAAAVARTRALLQGVQVHVERMRANVDANEGLLSEHVMMALAAHTGRDTALALVRAASERASRSGHGLRETLLGDDAITRHLSTEDIHAALDPSSYLGSTDALIDRALAAYEAERSGTA